MAGKKLVLIDQWLVNISHGQTKYQAELDQIPSLHGWVFNLRSGLINEVVRLVPPVVDSAGVKIIPAKASK